VFKADMKQTSFSSAEFAAKKRTTRRERFLAEMEQVVPWAALEAVIAPVYPKGERGRPPIGLSRIQNHFAIGSIAACARSTHLVIHKSDRHHRHL
jgi:hypothetical protein